MLVFRRTPQNVARIELDDRAAFNLGPAHALSYDQSLTQRMGVPSGPRPRFEVNDGSSDAGWGGPLELAGNRRLAREIGRWTVNGLKIRLPLNFHLCDSLFRGVRPMSGSGLR
jgi:hypothetical protein